MARLKADPEWVARNARQEAQRQQVETQLRLAEAPLVGALRAAGLEVQSVWDLVNAAVPYPEALPILVEHLRRPYPEAIRDGIARALAVRDAKFAWPALVDAYRREPPGRTKGGLAAAVAAASDGDVIGDVIALACDRRHGTSRLLLLSALERSKDPRARKTLMALGADPELQKEVQVILRRPKRNRR